MFIFKPVLVLTLVLHEPRPAPTTTTTIQTAGQRRRLYSAVPGRVFVATRAHSAQGEREISFNKGDRVKGEMVCYSKLQQSVHIHYIFIRVVWQSVSMCWSICLLSSLWFVFLVRDLCLWCFVKPGIKITQMSRKTVEPKGLLWG